MGRQRVATWGLWKDRAPCYLGFGLTEALVATTLLAIGFMLALLSYQSAHRALATGESGLELQQGLRAGLDRLAVDLRSAGLGVDPDGAPGRPDEAIEGAWETAIVIRADLDGRTADAHDPEDALAAAGPFANVTTGNDEIVAYVLAKPDGSSTGSLVLAADVRGVPRDGTVEKVTIAGVALVQDDPPYTLYRVTIKHNSTSSLRSPVIGDVRSLRFRYFEGAAQELAAPGGGEDETARSARRAIRSIGVRLEGVVGQADPRWIDHADPNVSTRHRRKLALALRLAPANLDLAGRADLGPDTPP